MDHLEPSTLKAEKTERGHACATLSCKAKTKKGAARVVAVLEPCEWADEYPIAQ